MKYITNKFKYDKNKSVCGLTKNLIGLYIYNYVNSNDEDTVVLTSNLYEANNYYKILKEYTDDVLLFPMDDFLTSVAVAISPDFKIKRLETLDTLKNDKKKKIVITSLMGYLRYLPNSRENQYLEIGGTPSNISREIILNTLDEYGYSRESLVTATGEYAVRGYIIDVFPTEYEHPIRIEFFGDDVDTIKKFDENTQLTFEKVDGTIKIGRFNENYSDKPSSLMDYMQNKNLFILDSNQFNNSYTILKQEIKDYNDSKNTPLKKYMFDMDEINVDNIFKVNSIDLFDTKDSIIYRSKDIINFNSSLESLKVYVLKNVKEKTIVFVLKDNRQIRIIQELFPDAFLTTDETIQKNKINIIKGNLTNGFIFEDYIVIAPYDIDKIKHKDIKYKNPLKMGYKIKSSDDLEIGDYVVHENYGIGIYNGIKTLKKGEYMMDYIQLIYAGDDKVYVPVENVDKLYKYSDKNGTVPKIDKLNSASWAKKKLAAKKKIKDISEKLLKLYTERSTITTTPYKDFEEEYEFALNFPYTLTPDQEKCIREINEDLKSPVPMDRLLCGDVGYGKTEVAFRAMFKTILNGKMCVYLCPTTILSKQQYTSALERFSKFPVRIELLNRYVSSKKENEIYRDLEDGKIDIIIGTHKLLNKKIVYKNLGLLVVDEEQRFGVSHKERIKELKSDINVLTLSATPIPRTLKMAMSGLRKLSVLDTPPVNRYPIETYVLEENDLIIRDAIYKELSRNGQVFILINDISSMNKLAAKIKMLVKEAKIILGHGQMNSNELNSVMEDFINYKYDILICTTIIETGIDIANVNTIIIIDADRFGLSQLYQIRGRVGRSDKIAYAYLMYKPSRILTETAKKRLESIKEFTELGSGYKIAMKDLSIRGAGDLLGSEQAGFIDAVGIDLYTKMLNEEVQKLNGKNIPNDDNDKKLSLNVSTHIDNRYIDDESIKIEIHKMIAQIKTREDLDRVKAELTDRFGKIDEKIEIYMLEKCVENLIDELKIKNIMQISNMITIILPKNVSDKMDGEKLFLQVYNINPKFKLSYKNEKIRISLETDKLQKNYIYYIFDLLTIINDQVNIHRN